MRGNVVDLTERLALTAASRRMFATMASGPELAQMMRPMLMKLSHDQQSAMLVVLTFIILGAPLPASLELLSRMPVFIGTPPAEIQAALEAMVDGGLLLFDGTHFDCPPLRAMITDFEQRIETPTFFSTDGSPLNR